MMNPLSFLLGNIPHSFSALGCFKRIQEFLILDERNETRDFRSGSCSKPSSISKDPTITTSEGLELEELSHVAEHAPHITIVDGTFNWADKTVLSEVTTNFPRRQKGSLTMIIGPIGSGKSSLLKAILGETASAGGVVSLDSPDIVFCD